MSQFNKETKISEKKYLKVCTLQNNTECQIYKVSVTALAGSMPANFLVLISTKLINQNLSKPNDEIF